jgi:hypothetical protein
MALTATTLASAMAANDTVMVVAASTGLTAGWIVEVDGESMQIVSNYTTGNQGVNVPVLRGQSGTVTSAHPSAAKVRAGAATDAGWGSQPAQTVTQLPIAGRARQVQSYSATGAIALPNPGNDLLVYLNGTSICAMTLADPGTGLDGSQLWIASNGAAAHTITSASGFSGAGSNYDVITFNATAPVLLGPFMAVNGLWQMSVAVPLAGTVTNVTATLA